VEVAAIVLIEADAERKVDSRSKSHLAPRNAIEAFTNEPLAFVELFGQSLLERVIGRFASLGVKVISLLVQPDLFSRMPSLRGSFGNLRIQGADEVWFQVTQTLKEYSENGIQGALIVKPHVYMEIDLADMIEFQRARRSAVTQAANPEGALDLWFVDCNATWPASVAAGAASTSAPPAASTSYVVKEYIRKIAHPRDLRQLAVDGFLSHCHIQPSGREIRPRVWAEDGVHIHRKARIVAPAYLGRGVTVEENALITRYSNIEASSYIDYGTAIEDTTVLANTYIGMGLDICHAVVHGNKLLNLKRGVVIETSDPCLFRSQSTDSMDARQRSSVVNWAEGAHTKLLVEGREEKSFTRN
jgi:carbonic anhydrase/acetyltransferase-like protein (isoleucine patch superfamily)